MSRSHIKKTLLEKARSFCYNYDVNKKMRGLRMKNDLKRAVGGGLSRWIGKMLMCSLLKDA